MLFRAREKYHIPYIFKFVFCDKVFRETYERYTSPRVSRAQIADHGHDRIMCKKYFQQII